MQTKVHIPIESPMSTAHSRARAPSSVTFPMISAWTLHAARLVSDCRELKFTMGAVIKWLCRYKPVATAL